MMKHSLYLLLTIPFLISCSHIQSTDAPAERIIKVGVVRVNNNNADDAKAEYVGNIEGSAAVDVSFSAVGRVANISVKEGDRVRKGQILAYLDNATATSSYQAAKATLDRATDAYNRAKQVYDKGSLPEVKWIEVQTQLNQARSLCDIAKKNLADCSLTAPLSATVEKRYIEPGTTVSPMQPVVRLVDISNLYVRMSVPEADIASIAIGDSVRVSVNAADSVTLLGIIKEKDISADAISHSYLVRARLIATREQMRSILPGMVCRVKIDSPLPPQNAGAQQLLVPNRAVQIDNNGQRFVWVVTEDSTAVRRPVVIGDLTARGVLIIDGLSQGDIIVTDGTQKIASGTKVSF